jgi:hypothetical protein
VNGLSKLIPTQAAKVRAKPCFYLWIEP